MKFGVFDTRLFLCKKSLPWQGQKCVEWMLLCVTVLSASACIAVITENSTEAAAGAGLCGGRKEV